VTDTSTTPPSATGRASSAWMTQARAFVTRVEAICAGDPGARAALRSGLGKPLDEVQRMHRIVVPLLPPNVWDDDTQRAFYTVASMIAAQKSETLRATRTTPSPDASGAAGDEAQTGTKPSPYGASLGMTFAAAVALPNGLRENSAETRLNLLTRQSTLGLHRHLPASVRQLCDKQTPPDWAQLLVHLRAWPQDRKAIGRRWLQDFYRARNKAALEAARKAADTPPESND
jgi:CRISPR system Cascade subunit CasB